MGEAMVKGQDRGDEISAIEEGEDGIGPSAAGTEATKDDVAFLLAVDGFVFGHVLLGIEEHKSAEESVEDTPDWAIENDHEGDVPEAIDRGVAGRDLNDADDEQKQS